MMMLRVFGGFLMAMGIIWALQGAGMLAWPAGSVMIARREWVMYGAGLGSIGAGLVWLASRIGRSRR